VSATAALGELLREVRAFVDGPAAQWGEEIERSGTVPDWMWRELRHRGYLRLAAPQELGGRGLALTEYLHVLEEFSRGHGSLRMIVHVANGIWRPVLRRATPEQVERFVRPHVRGDALIAFALTEPGAGSGADIRTEAHRQGDHYVLHGEKHLITFGDVADWFLLFARLPGTRGADGTVALMVHRDSPGLRIVPMPESMGLRGTGHGHLFLEGCRVPVDHRIGAEGEGLDVALRGFLDPSRICLAMSCVGLGQRALELALARARVRVTFGRPIGERQMVQALLAEAAADLEAARQIVLWAGRRWEERPPATAEASMAKLFASEALQRVTDRALQVFGGIGYFRGQEIERVYRDARAQRFEEGTAEIHKATIARHLLAFGSSLRAGDGDGGSG
jgi:alkylation response protein AidB-like acyl-CoA dehydrogenase